MFFRNRKKRQQATGAELIHDKRQSASVTEPDRPLEVSTADGIPYVYKGDHEVVVSYVPDGATLYVGCGGARILVLGDVGQGAKVIAEGGGAFVVVLGDVGRHSDVIAYGGGARVVVVGRLVGDVNVHAEGGGAHARVYHGKIQGPHLEAKSPRAMLQSGADFVARLDAAEAGAGTDVTVRGKASSVSRANARAMARYEEDLPSYVSARGGGASVALSRNSSARPTAIGGGAEVSRF